jgi:hypothetical protein
MQLKKPFLGVPDGEIYPVQYQPGEECPAELEASATALGAFEDEDPAAPAATARTKK